MAGKFKFIVYLYPLDKERLRTLIGLAAIAVGGTTLVRLFV